MVNLELSDLRPIQLTLEGAGPFRDRFELRFFGESISEELEPANVFLLLAPNGRGKTTVIENVGRILRLLNPEYHRDEWLTNFLRAGSRGQLDIRLGWTHEGVRTSVLASIWVGSEVPLTSWETELEEVAHATNWAQIGFGSRGNYFANELGRILVDTVADNVGVQPNSVFGVDMTLPTGLVFPATRSLIRPGEGRRGVTRPRDWRYDSYHRFDVDGAEWESSMDNLLVWLTWLNDGRYELIQDYVSSHVFLDGGKRLGGIRREELTAVVETTDGGRHSIDQLSHGERQLFQLIVRIASHMTSNTIVMIDEIEQHLHPRWAVKVLALLKNLAVEFPGLSFLISTHSRDVQIAYNHDVPEDGIVKGGYLIDEGLE